MITLWHFKRGNLVYSAIHTNRGSNLRSIIYYLEKKTVGEIETEYFSHLFHLFMLGVVTRTDPGFLSRTVYVE